jgi:hypothetical protein
MSTEEIPRKAPAGKFRVIGIAPRDGQTYFIGDFDNPEAAEQSARDHGSVGNPVHVYNDHGQLVVRYGSRQ